jgi:hypothetical protein
VPNNDGRPDARRTPLAQPAAASPTNNAASGAAKKEAELYHDQNDTWVDRRAPAWLRPYLKLTRIDRPIGTYLILLPGWWGLALSAAPGHLPDPTLAAIFGRCHRAASRPVQAVAVAVASRRPLLQMLACLDAGLCLHALPSLACSIPLLARSLTCRPGRLHNAQRGLHNQ